MVWTCRAQHRLDCRSTQAECGCTENIWQAKEIMGWSAGEWQKEARYGFCWPSEPFWVERTPSRKTCQKAQPSVEENGALKWIWWWWCFERQDQYFQNVWPDNNLLMLGLIFEYVNWYLWCQINVLAKFDFVFVFRKKVRSLLETDRRMWQPSSSSKIS